MQCNKNVTRKFYMHFFLFFNSKSTLQKSIEESKYSNIDNSSMVNSTPLSKSSCNVIFSTFSTPNVSRRFEGPKSGRLPLGNRQIFSTSGLEGYRETLVKSGISERAAHLIATLTFSWRRPLSYRNQSFDLRSKSRDWFLYDNGLRHERVKDTKFIS